MKLRAW